MTEAKCAVIKRLTSIIALVMKQNHQPDIIDRNGRIFSVQDQILILMDEVLTEKVASQQQTLAVAEGALQNVTITCKQCGVNLVLTKGEQHFF